MGKIALLIGYLLVALGIACGISLAAFPVLPREVQAPIHGALCVLGVILISLALRAR